VIAALILSGPLPSRIFTLRKVSRTRLKDVLLADKPKNNSLEAPGRCSKPLAPIAAKLAKFHLPQEVINRFTATNVILSTETLKGNFWKQKTKPPPIRRGFLVAKRSQL